MKAELIKVYFMDTVFGYKVNNVIEVEKIIENYYRDTDGSVFYKDQLKFVCERTKIQVKNTQFVTKAN